MSRAHPALSRLTALVTATTLGASMVVVSPGVAQAEQKTTYLGLEGEGDPVESLSDALRWELTQRGRDDGRSMTLAELKLTMGCGDDDIACFAQGGQTLGSDELVFGSMTPAGDGWTVSLSTIDVASGEVVRSFERELRVAELSDAAIADTAKALLNELYEVQADVSDIPPEEVDDGFGDIETQTEERSDGGLVWGRHRPTPQWKLVGLGVSAGLTGVALGVGVGFSIAVQTGSIREDLLAAADESLADDDPRNDVDKRTNADLCGDGELGSNFDPVASVCARSDLLENGQYVSYALAGAFAVSTIVFTTLLFVHRDKPGAAALRKHQLRFGGTPVQGGGFVVGGSMRF